MKKLYSILLLSCLFLFVAKSYSQTSIGMKTGYNLSKITGDWKNIFGTNNIKPKNFEGYHFGIYFDIPIAEKFFFQPEFFYSMKGVRFNEIISTSKGVTELRIIEEYNFFEAPVLIKYNRKGFNLLAGPFIAILIGKSIKFSKQDDRGTISFHQTGGGAELFDYGLTAGIGYTFPFNLGLNVRYAQGIRAINEAASGKFYTSSFQFGATYQVFKEKTP